MVAHETGHYIDNMAANIPQTGLLNELKQVYHDMATGQQGRTTKRMRECINANPRLAKTIQFNAGGLLPLPATPSDVDDPGFVS